MTLQEIRLLARTVYELSCDEKSTADRHLLAQLRSLATAVEGLADHLKTAAAAEASPFEGLHEALTHVEAARGDEPDRLPPKGAPR